MSPDGPEERMAEHDEYVEREYDRHEMADRLADEARDDSLFETLSDIAHLPVTFDQHVAYLDRLRDLRRADPSLPAFLRPQAE